ncbi:hypothetical protein VTJ04DRAFT_4647 [Mycothermus thermophilus]|uniref:uncharacterized protein n=1 Tax=Humicola insolens TaxID=85995 RepID=UPI003742BE01
MGTEYHHQDLTHGGSYQTSGEDWFLVNCLTACRDHSIGTRHGVWNGLWFGLGNARGSRDLSSEGKSCHE